MLSYKNTLFFVASLCMAGSIEAAKLQDIGFSELPGERTEIRLKFDEAPSTPSGYAIDKPARIVFDFGGVENRLKQKKFSVDVGDVNGAVVVEGGGRTRVIINLDSMSTYTTRADGSDLVIDIGSEVSGISSNQANSSTNYLSADASQTSDSSSTIENVDFRRGDVGEGKVIIALSNSASSIDVQEVSGGINIRFLGTEMPSELRRKLDVVDFATPVSLLTASQSGRDAVVSVAVKGEYDYLAYQADNQYVVSVKPLTKAQQEEKKKKFAYTGERLSLNFQNIEVRSVLQLIADFTELNLVASDTVTGSITLRLDNVPWDQALDIVLKTKGLDKRQIGNVLMVAPAAEIAQRERQEIETQKQLEELAPLRTEYIRIRYANARELFELFIDNNSNGGGGGGSGQGSNGQGNSTGTLLSDRGQAIVDERTNSIILTDTDDKIIAFKELVDTIDIPIRQVMIEARIVIANNDFNREFGSRVGLGGIRQRGDSLLEFAGDSTALPDGRVLSDDGTDISFTDVVDLGVFDPAGALTLNLLRSNFLVGLELTALEESGFAEIVSQPKVITGDKQQASIESGTEVPFLEESASGGATVSFKEATLKLDVTPQITPDNKVIMDLIINQDAVGAIDIASGVPLIDITQLETQVLVSDGETVVLGGIYQTEQVIAQSKVPFLGDIPFVGWLFRNDVKTNEKRELLIFITPRILANSIVE